MQRRSFSADAHGLLLGLDHGHDALLLSRVRGAGVFDGQLVDDLPRRIALVWGEPSGRMVAR
jgi:hypothetical protein